MWKCEKSSPCLLLWHPIRALNRPQFRHYQKCTSPCTPFSGITCTFDIGFPTLRLVAMAHCNTHVIFLLPQLVSLASLPPPLLRLSTALTGRSMTLHRTIRLLLPFACAKQTGIWLLLHVLTTPPLLSVFRTMQFPSTFFLSILIWYFWVTGVTELYEKSIQLMSGQLLISNTLKYCNFS